MSSHRKPQTSNLPSLFSEILEVGGLRMLHTNENIFMNSESVEELFKRHSITTTKTFFGLLFAMNTFGEQSLVEPLLVEGYKRGLLKKEDLVLLYLSQSESVRAQMHPLLTLKELWGIPHKATLDTYKVKDAAPSIPRFSKEEIIALANQVVHVHSSDIEMFFQGWFYRRDEPFPFTKEFLTHWFNYNWYEVYRPDGKIESLIAIALFQTYPECITQNEVTEKMYELSERDPTSHGIHRYCSLSFWMAGEDTEKRQKAIDGYVESIIMMIQKSVMAHDAQFAIELLLEEPGITKAEKVAAVGRIQKVCNVKARTYTDIVIFTTQELAKL